MQGWRGFGRACFALVAVRLAAAEPPRNVILMVGDGMGPGQIEAASYFAHGAAGKLFMESLPNQAQVVTCPAYAVASNATAVSGGDPLPAYMAGMPPKVTDSAAAGTAMATGHKVYNGVLALALPGDSRRLPTILEQFKAAGKRTGLVTTSTLTDATPSAFGAHVKARAMNKEITAQYFAASRPNLLLGAADKGTNAWMRPLAGVAAGYLTVTNRTGMQAFVTATNDHRLGLFGVGPMCYEYDAIHHARKDFQIIPHLTEMTATALAVLTNAPAGFFLMIEGACIDKGCHVNHLGRAVHETIEFDKAVRQVAAWVRGRSDTLLLVVADHETGGLKVVKGKEAGKLPDVTWKAKQHTGANVRLFALGAGAERVSGTLDNTDVYRLMAGAYTAPFHYVPPLGGTVPPPPKAVDDKD